MSGNKSSAKYYESVNKLEAKCFNTFLQILPKEKIEMVSDEDVMSISFEEAKHKVSRAINNISKNQGIDLNTAIEKVLYWP